MLYQGILTFGFITNVMDLTSFQQFKSKDLIILLIMATIYFLVSQLQEFGVRSR